MDENEIREAISRYKFYHIINLTDNIITPGYSCYVPAQNLCRKHLESLDLNDKRVLDIGCRDGLFSFAAEKMGAREVIGIDNDLSEAATEFLIPFFKSKVKMEKMNLYDLTKDNFGLFDVVIFPGVLYHLRYPFWGLKAIRDVMNIGGHLLIETAIWEGMPNKAMLFCPIGNEGPYGVDETSCTFFNEKGLIDTMKSLGFETVSAEYLREKKENVPKYQSITKHFDIKIRKMLDNIGLSKSEDTRTATRCVFHLIFRGYDQKSFIMQYWEKTHRFHNQDGSPRTG